MPKNSESAFDMNEWGWHPLLWIAIAVLLLLPLLAMQFTDEVNWTGYDFVAMSILLIGAGAIYEIAVRRTAARRYRLFIGAAILAVVLLIWAEGAVGIF